MGRRAFLRWTGSAGLVALGACYAPPHGKVMPYARRPPDVTPGVPLTFATACEAYGYGVGLVVESREGRPVKIEGNPEHPSSLGASGSMEQALLMRLYDPGRARAVLRSGTPTSYRTYAAELSRRAEALEASRGQGLRLLLETTASPLLSELRGRIRDRFPRARVDAYHPLSRAAVHEGARLALGEPVEAVTDFRRARAVLALDADPLADGPRWLADARGIADARAPAPDRLQLRVVEPSLTVSGMYADDRLRVRPSGVEAVALAVLRELADVRGLPALAWARGLGAALEDPAQASFARRAADDLARARDRGVVVVGRSQPARLHALAHALNEALGSAGSTVAHVEPALDDVHDDARVLARLADELRAGEVEVLVVGAFDPLYTAPGDVRLAEALGRARLLVVHAHEEGETGRGASWFVPAATVLETWGDARAVDGTASIVQPLIAPLFDAFGEAQLLGPLAGVPEPAPHTLLRDAWRRRRGSPGFDRDWDAWLARGVVPDTGARAVRARVDVERVRQALAAAPRPRPAALELALRPSYALHDGRHAGNPWLQELPDPVTKQSWGNAALVSPATARRLGAATGRAVRLTVGDDAVELPLLVLPGQADDTIAVALGYGRPAPPPMRGERIGGNAYALRRAQAPWSPPGLGVAVLPGTAPVVVAQPQAWMEDRVVAIAATYDEYASKGARFLHEHRGPVEKLYDPFTYEGEKYKWAMAIDLDRCIGCSACMVACQAENNIPVVGRENVRLGRDMHWLRVHRYFEGTPEDPTAITQPMMCQHCEAAPCEYVCPVNATVHSDEGLNEMVYNRCVGTRWCSNNCPYKVRRFNWLAFHAGEGPIERMAHNPEVTVRARGVMEKCTYCVQRIEAARIDARSAGRDIDTRALQTACQQACPTRAIVFGSLHDEDSPVARLHRSDRRYEVLHELGTRPRTVYLARIRGAKDEG